MATTQTFKSIYFHDHKKTNLKSKGVVLAFGEKNKDLYKRISFLNSDKIRNLLGTNSFIELNQRAEKENLSINTYCLWYLRKNLKDSENVKQNYSIENTSHISDILNRVIEGDCLEKMKLIPPKSIDMILCDLPYGTTQNEWDSVISLEKLWKEYERIIKNEGAIVLTSQGLFTNKLISSNEKLFKYKIVWIKSKATNFLNAKKQPLRKHEDICVFYKKPPTYNPQMTYGEAYDKGFRKDQHTGSYGLFETRHVKSNGERYPTDIVYFKTAESEGEVFHPTQKPISLGRYLIKTFTNKGDIVLDNTCGSGSFLVSAILEDRNFIGIELNKENVLHHKTKIDIIKICNERIRKAEKERKNKKFQKNLFNDKNKINGDAFTLNMPFLS